MTKMKKGAQLMESARRELFTCVVGDVMDKLRLFHQFLPPQIHPLRHDMVLLGPAMPVLSADVFEESISGSSNPMMQTPFGLMLEALDALRHDEVYISTGATPRNAMWGELMSIRAAALGSAGAVLNGYLRDTRAILALGFPAFSLGSWGQDSAPRYKVVDYRVPIEIGGVRIEPGDIVFGDIDGVCVVPKLAAEEVFRKSLEKVRQESRVRASLEKGGSAVDAFRRFGVM